MRLVFCFDSFKQLAYCQLVSIYLVHRVQASVSNLKNRIVSLRLKIIIKDEMIHFTCINFIICTSSFFAIWLTSLQCAVSLFLFISLQRDKFSY